MKDAPTEGSPPQPDLPPSWGKDGLSEMLEMAHGNQLATFVQKNEWYTRLARIDELFARVSKHWTNPRDPIPALLLLRCHSAFRAACGLAMAGQAAEATVMQRSCLEYAAYALHISRSPGLGRLWLDRHANPEAEREVRRRFQIKEVRNTILPVNRHAAERFDMLYQRAIDFGGHPNERGVTSNMEIENQPDRILLKQMFLHGSGLQIEHSLKNMALCGIVCLEILQGVFGALFTLLGVSDDMLKLRRGL